MFARRSLGLLWWHERASEPTIQLGLIRSLFRDWQRGTKTPPRSDHYIARENDLVYAYDLSCQRLRGELEGSKSPVLIHRSS